jgi:hypothetical protein
MLRFRRIAIFSNERFQMADSQESKARPVELILTPEQREQLMRELGAIGVNALQLRPNLDLQQFFVAAFDVEASEVALAINTPSGQPWI